MNEAEKLGVAPAFDGDINYQKLEREYSDAQMAYDALVRHRQDAGAARRIERLSNAIARKARAAEFRKTKPRKRYKDL